MDWSEDIYRKFHRENDDVSGKKVWKVGDRMTSYREVCVPTFLQMNRLLSNNTHTHMRVFQNGTSERHSFPAPVQFVLTAGHVHSSLLRLLDKLNSSLSLPLCGVLFVREAFHPQVRLVPHPSTSFCSRTKSSWEARSLLISLVARGSFCRSSLTSRSASLS